MVYLHVELFVLNIGRVSIGRIFGQVNGLVICQVVNVEFDPVIDAFVSI